MKRILLFLATNLAIVVLLGIVLRLLGVESILDESGTGLNLGALLIFAAVFGFAGSFISLAISKWSAKRMMGVRVIAQPANATESWLVNTVRNQAQQAGIGMPEVGVFDSPEPNAFATGARRNAALVAVSTGLLQSMSQQEAEAVLAHEVTHVANGDMVTLALIQGVVNTFVIFLARVIGHTVDRVVFRNARPRPGVLDHNHRRRAGAWPVRYDHRDVVLPPARVPRRCGRSPARRPAAHDRRARAADAAPPPPAPRQDGGLWHRGRRRRRPQASLYVAPAARGADRGARRPGRLKP
jgi:hypothetical protein